MRFWEILVLGVGLSMDAFAVSVCKGLAMRQKNRKYGFVIAGFFGFFQAMMPFLGWLLGRSFASYIEAYDHWIAFGLLALVGGKMIFDAVKELRSPPEEEAADPDKSADRINFGELLILSVATSIDALAVGLSFAMLNMGFASADPGLMNIWSSVLVIGVTTFLISLSGVNIGNRVGIRFQAKAEIAGGIVLIGLGIRILLEHLLG